ncbi:MAG: HIT family protein [Methanoculleus marisnigri]|nr:HIT family protein [Methanoculleus marisnigri]
MFGAPHLMFGARLRTNRPGHLLIIPYRHVADFFDATDAELAALLALVREAKTLLDGRFRPDGYNVGVNVGEAAGQTVMHLHLHVIPRYAGDVKDPRGGVRGAVPEKRVY